MHIRKMTKNKSLRFCRKDHQVYIGFANYYSRQHGRKAWNAFVAKTPYTAKTGIYKETPRETMVAIFWVSSKGILFFYSSSGTNEYYKLNPSTEKISMQPPINGDYIHFPLMGGMRLIMRD